MHGDKRQLLIDKATALFSEHGFQAVGVDLIIREADVARMTLYRNFAGKDELIREVLLQRYGRIFESIARNIKPIKDPKLQIKCIFDWYANWFCTPEFTGCLFERALAEFGTKRPMISDVAMLYRNTLTDLMFGILKAIVASSSAKRLAHVFVMLLDGATVEARAANEFRFAGLVWEMSAKLIDQEMVGGAKKTKK